MNTEKIQLGCKIEYNPPLPTVTISKNAKIVKRIFVMQSSLKFKKSNKMAIFTQKYIDFGRINKIWRKYFTKCHLYKMILKRI